MPKAPGELEDDNLTGHNSDQHQGEQLPSEPALDPIDLIVDILGLFPTVAEVSEPAAAGVEVWLRLP